MLPKHDGMYDILLKNIFIFYVHGLKSTILLRKCIVVIDF